MISLTHRTAAGMFICCQLSMYLPAIAVLTAASLYLKLDYEHKFFFSYFRDNWQQNTRQTSISRTSCLRTLRVDQSKLSALTELLYRDYSVHAGRNMLQFGSHIVYVYIKARRLLEIHFTIRFLSINRKMKLFALFFLIVVAFAVAAVRAL